MAVCVENSSNTQTPPLSPSPALELFHPTPNLQEFRLLLRGRAAPGGVLHAQLLEPFAQPELQWWRGPGARGAQRFLSRHCSP